MMAEFYAWEVDGMRDGRRVELRIAGFGEGNILALINDFRTFDQSGNIVASTDKPNVRASMFYSFFDNI